MRNFAMKMAIGIAITSLGLFAADNSIGTWKRNIAKSTSTATNPNPYTSQTTVREAVAGGVKVTSTGVRKDGKAANGSYTAKYDGKFVPVAGGGAFDSIAIKQVDANTFTSEAKKTGGKYRLKGKSVVSSDGKTMTSTLSGTDADGKPISVTAVYDKQ